MEREKDGARVALDATGIPILDTNGGILGYRGASADVTERKRAEADLRLSNFTLENVPVAIFWWDVVAGRFKTSQR